jgi:RNA recognition motif-containing protein
LFIEVIVPAIFFSDTLQGYFSQFGEITDCIVMKNPQTGKSRGFGFVSFKDPSTVDVILSSKNHIVDGRTVNMLCFVDALNFLIHFLFFEGCLQFLFFLSIFYSLLLVIEET